MPASLLWYRRDEFTPASHLPCMLDRLMLTMEAARRVTAPAALTGYREPAVHSTCARHVLIVVALRTTRTLRTFLPALGRHPLAVPCSSAYRSYRQLSVERRRRRRTPATALVSRMTARVDMRPPRGKLVSPMSLS